MNKKILIVSVFVVGLLGYAFYNNQVRADDKQEAYAVKFTQTAPIPEGMREIYFAGGCFWGVEKLFEGIEGVQDVESGYANGDPDIVPNYKLVVTGSTGYREAVRVVYDPEQVRLEQLLTAYFHVIDPTVKKRQGPDVGDQYQTGIYFVDETSAKVIKSFVAEERKKHLVFAVEIGPLTSYTTAEEYHQDYLTKNPNGYCHISQKEFDEINDIISSVPVITVPSSSEEIYQKPDQKDLKSRLTRLQYDVTQNGATERPFTGEYWNFYEKGIYVDVTTGEPLFSSLDKYESSCGWPSFTAPIEQDNVAFYDDNSLGMQRTEVKSNVGDAHLGHVFYNDPESPNGVRYCINSASLEFIPYEEMEARGYGDWLPLFDENK